MKTKSNSTFSEDYRKELCRKSLHLSSLWMPVLIYFAPKIVSSSIFALILLADFCVEYGNYKNNKIARKLLMLFSFIMRKKEFQKNKFTPTGSIYVLLSALICSVFFTKNIAVISLSVMLISDTFAALVGKIYGKHKIYENKSLEGSLTFLGSAILVMFLLNDLYPFSFVGFFACVVATLAELFEKNIKIDDNLSIPLSIGIILQIFMFYI